MRYPTLGLAHVVLTLCVADFAAAQDTPLPDQELIAMVETYGQAMQEKSEVRFLIDLYQGPIPGENKRFLRALFDRTEELSMLVETRELEVDGERAVAVIDCTLHFLHSTTGEQKTAHYRFRLIFESGVDGWRLKKFERA
jgi:hypothetical protein